MDAKDLISRSTVLKSLGERKMACERRDYMSDTISRQDAIDEVVAWLKDRMSDGKNGKPLTDRLKDLPSAQPEIIHCKDCKFAEVVDKEDNQDGYTCQFHRGSIWFSGSYCSWAERQEE